MNTSKTIRLYMMAVAMLTSIVLFQSCTEEECQGVECLNGGKCFVNDDGFAECECPEGFSGAACEDEDLCAFVECPDNATCEIENGEAFCFCNVGYQGENCDEEIRAKYFGTYSATDVCPSGTFDFTSSVTASSLDVARFNIENFGGFQRNVYGVVISETEFYIPEQTFVDANGITFQVHSGRTFKEDSIGNFVNNKMVFTYTSIPQNGSNGEVCDAVYDKL